MITALENKMNALDTILKNSEFAKADAIKAAIVLVEKACKEKNKKEQQNLLDQAHGLLDLSLVRDFSGLATHSGDNVVEIVKNAFVLDSFAVEVNDATGEYDPYFYYMPAKDALTFLKCVLANMDKQVANLTIGQDKPVPNTNKAKNTRKYKAIHKSVVAVFDEQVVSMLGNVAGNDLSLDAATDEGCVFADKVTDAMFYAWSYNYKNQEVAEGCLYDYLATGDKQLLK
jgi:hypothetical protein